MPGHATRRSPATTPQSPAPHRGERARRRVQVFILFVCAVVLGNALVGERGLLQMLRARHDNQRLAASIMAARQENAALQEQARQLREDPTAIERLARQELGLIRPGEIVVIVRTVPTGAR